MSRSDFAQRARLALMAASLNRATGAGFAAAAERAARLAEQSGDDELRVPALALAARALLDSRSAARRTRHGRARLAGRA